MFLDQHVPPVLKSLGPCHDSAKVENDISKVISPVFHFQHLIKLTTLIPPGPYTLEAEPEQTLLNLVLCSSSPCFVEFKLPTVIIEKNE